MATPIGTVDLGRAPASAAGPDLRQLFLGSEGALRRDHVGDRPRAGGCPTEQVYEGWRWPSFDAGAEAMRTLAQAQLLPTVLRLSDENETAINLADPDAVGGAAGRRLPDDRRARGHAGAGRRRAGPRWRRC